MTTATPATVDADPYPFPITLTGTALTSSICSAISWSAWLRGVARQRRIPTGGRRPGAGHRAVGGPEGRHAVIHTREGHLPDLSDCPPAKLRRGKPTARIGDPGPNGRILIRGEPGHDIIDTLYPIDGEPVIDKPGKGRSTPPGSVTC